MGDIPRIASIRCGHVLQRVKIIAPRVRHAAGVVEVFFIHLFDIGRVATEEKSVALIGRIDGRTRTHFSLTSVSLRGNISWLKDLPLYGWTGWRMRHRR
jgi:hypothetical protein